MLTLDDFLAEQMKDPEFKAEWDALEPEFQALRESLEKEPIPLFYVQDKQQVLLG